MSAVPEIIRRAESLGVRLCIDGETVRMAGPKEARDVIRADVIAHKPELLQHLRAGANDAESIPADCVGALRDPDGGLYLPWGPRRSADEVRRMRAELVAMIEALADMEHWDAGRRDDVLTRAIRGPLTDLMPNLHHFAERLSEARAEAEARAALDRRTWRMEGFDDRRLTCVASPQHSRRN